MNQDTLALALEAEQEAEAVADTYEGLAQVLDIENSLSDAKQASDVAMGLENLNLVLESLKDLDINDVALIQVVGDIAGASSGLPGSFFTPAMEDMEDGEATAEQKSTSIMEKIAEIIKYVIEKISAFIAWAAEKFRRGYRDLKEAASGLKGMVGRKMEMRKIDAMREKIAIMHELAKVIESYIPLVADLAAVRLEASGAEAGHIEETMPVSTINKMDSLYRQLEAFNKKFGEKELRAGVKIEAKVERVSHVNVLATAASFSKNYFEVSQSLLGRTDVSDDTTLSKVGHDLISQIEDVVDEFSRFMSESGTLSLTTLGKSVKTHLGGIQKVIDSDSAGGMFRHQQRVGKTRVAVLREVVQGLSRDVSSIVKLGGLVDTRCAAMSKQLSAMKNIDMEPAAA